MAYSESCGSFTPSAARSTSPSPAGSSKVPVNAPDLSGTLTISHAISTKPGLDTGYGQLLFDAGGDLNNRNRYSGGPHFLVFFFSLKVARYCDPAVRSCQKVDWPHHKKNCVKVVDPAEGFSFLGTKF
jgi:hypothetical protein